MDIQPFATTTQAAAARAADLAPQAVVSKKAGVDPAQKVKEAQQANPVPSEDQVTQALKSINDLLQSRSPDLEFSVDKDSDRTIVKVVDKKTLEVIRQMPSEEALQIAKALDRLQSMLIRQTA
ncbi:flagellar protein FlaG [Massilia psychrophila]|uniref:Flagellar biosynthesis protein FlaG n=1 Tax=Massilia psychrophila TaxID=1603353 RepID=A0A2G8SZ80_9BURK|nr:flagellar protein FlaG [Massilia psychrophila]PIL39105.1 hypothetical protein CR103_14150 [Massilia psychrophila]GGE84919.1 flagellar protein FlaG [Massilia psychrophila]